MQNPDTALASTVVIDEPILDADELKQLARLLDVLMEVDFYLNRKQMETTND